MKEGTGFLLFFSTVEFSMGKKVSRGELSGEITHWGNLHDCFIMSYFLFLVSILRLDL